MSTRAQALDLGPLADFHDAGHGDTAEFRRDVLEGLSQSQKVLPCKYFYDERGSKLFDQICALEEYYPTRTELRLLKDRASDIAAGLGPNVTLVEFGSGSSIKVRILLDALGSLDAYVPVDISREHLISCTQALAADYPDLTVIPVCADYTQPFEFPIAATAGSRVGFFPGSTIGNFPSQRAMEFLSGVRANLGSGAGLLIGVDLKKDTDILWQAYNDREGITAAFNKNLLRRINAELGAEFDLKTFEHRAPYNAARGCVEMHLVSTDRQEIAVAGQTFAFDAGETIHTEDSHKYSVPEFQSLAGRAGWNATDAWTDPDDLFSVHHLVAD